jgi:hypothetical protein
VSSPTTVVDSRSPHPQELRVAVDRIVYLGEDAHGRALEVMAVQGDHGTSS